MSSIEFQRTVSREEFRELRWAVIKIAQPGLDPFPEVLRGDAPFCEMDVHKLNGIQAVAMYLVMVWNPQRQIMYRAWRMCHPCQEGSRFLHSIDLTNGKGDSVRP